MACSGAFHRFARTFRIAAYCEKKRIKSAEGIAQLSAVSQSSRREFLTTGLATAGAARLQGGPVPTVDVGIVGAGLAGLACAYELKKAGLLATLYEASPRAGGRCFSMGGSFPGPVNFPEQVVERGGEFIDTSHKTMLGYAREFGLTLEDVNKAPGEVVYFFDGLPVPERNVVEEFRALVSAMRVDLRALSNAPTAVNHTPADVALDFVNLEQYLKTRGAGRLAFAAIEQAYIAEYGLSIDRQSCLNFLLFIHADRRSKFTPFGVFSDERYHIMEGNEAIARGLADRVRSQIRHAKQLMKLERLDLGRIRLWFHDGQSADHDAVVLAIPFTILRTLDLSASGLPSWKRLAIDTLGYGTNAKMMVGFNSPFWRQLGSNGASYSALVNHQATWETNPSAATAEHAVLTDYSGAARGQNLNLLGTQAAAGLFISDLERVFPGAIAMATRNGGQYLVHLEHWPSNPITRGSYTCYLPGQFTTIAGNEGKAVDNIFFAGEHANSFYEFQGFMEGAALSGIQAAAAILRKSKN